MLIDDGVHPHLSIWPLQDEEVQADGVGRGAALQAQLILHGASDGMRGVLALVAVEGGADRPLVAESREAARLIEELSDEVICAVWLQL